ncbi:hypothetical protein [Bacillus thuringiensis]|uniref:hypothetical protein n=1 Tax=Bacillus thuringiensis TaxID=1428 RepID=UPI0021D6543C|nr:hypothetical protein [Bacillus thuringiensis]MCU7666934.1 hypothetical protein [Bacillus thuringiensis]
MRGKKLKKRKIMMFGIAVLIAGLNISMYAGNSEKEKVVIVRGDIDVNRTLGEQLEQFTTIEIKKNDSMKMGDSVVRSLGELTDKRISVPLTQGSPIPKSVLLDGKGIGQFASSTRVYQTVYKMTGAVTQLPKGIKTGDKIDVNIMTISNDNKKEKRLDVFMRDVEIQSLTEADVIIKVSQDEFNKLTMASELGKFVLQLPGQKSVPSCSELSEEDKLSKECYRDGDKPGTVTSTDILKTIQTGEVINQADIDEAKKVKENLPKKDEQELSNPDQEQGNQDVKTRKNRDDLINSFDR